MYCSILLYYGGLFMTSKNYLFKLIVSAFCFAMIFSTSIAFAATTLLSYSATGVRDMHSANSFTLSSQTKVTLKHNTTGVTYNGTQPNSKAVLTVNLMRKGTVLYAKTGGSFTTTGIKSKTVSWKKSAGTYRLQFTTTALSETWWPGVDINGKVTK